MWSRTVVMLKPPRQRDRRCCSTAADRPTPQGRLDKAFGLAIRPWSIGPRAMRAHMKRAAGGPEARGAVAGAVVGQDAAHAYAVLPEPAERAAHERAHGHAELIGQQLEVRRARVIVDRHVQELPAEATAAVQPTHMASDAMPDARDVAEFLGVQMQQVARLPMLIAQHVRRRLT